MQWEYSAESVGNIEVKRGDRNLLEVTPGAWCHDSGASGEHSGFRTFCAVALNGDIQMLDSSWCRSVVPHGIRSSQPALSIGEQLALLSQDSPPFVVETHGEKWDYEDKVLPTVTVYKMDNLNFSRGIDRAEKDLYVRAGYPSRLFEE